MFFSFIFSSFCRYSVVVVVVVVVFVFVVVVVVVVVVGLGGGDIKILLEKICIYRTYYLILTGMALRGQ